MPLPASGMGKTSCKGQKGQQSRKGHKHKLVFEGGQMHHRSRRFAIA